MTDGVSWVLLDVGNVVIRFDHSTVAARLQTESRPRAGHVVVEPTAQRAAIDRFIFASSVAGSPNEALDRGTRDLEWLREQVCRQFDVIIDAALFEEIWTSIFAADVNDAVVTWASAMRSGARDCGDTATRLAASAAGRQAREHRGGARGRPACATI
ncbi:MAG: hypothetical protein NTW72_13340 [Gemmatimonadetes bacterium]|nr:hypothetical protein [Gemmatimonadota bacterium]